MRILHIEFGAVSSGNTATIYKASPQDDQVLQGLSDEKGVENHDSRDKRIREQFYRNLSEQLGHDREVKEEPTAREALPAWVFPGGPPRW